MILLFQRELYPAVLAQYKLQSLVLELLDFPSLLDYFPLGTDDQALHPLGLQLDPFYSLVVDPKRLLILQVHTLDPLSFYLFDH